MRRQQAAGQPSQESGSLIQREQEPKEDTAAQPHQSHDDMPAHHVVTRRPRYGASDQTDVEEQPAEEECGAEPDPRQPVQSKSRQEERQASEVYPE